MLVSRGDRAPQRQHVGGATTSRQQNAQRVPSLDGLRGVVDLHGEPGGRTADSI